MKILLPICLALISPDSSPGGTGWWPPGMDTWFALIGGPASGCIGALLGVLAGKGIARRLVLGIWRCCIAWGILCLIGALVAFKTGQPDYVGETLLIYGVIYTTIFSTIWPIAKKRYREHEIRRMASMDATGH